MAIHHYLVTVETDDRHLDAPDSTAIANEIRSNLEFDSPSNGIVHVHVTVSEFTNRRSYREAVIGSHEQ